MSPSHSSKRILIVGREVGPITQLLKKRIPNASIGAVDVLGNQETRLYADWKFSVEKQTPDMPIFRSKHRVILDLLYELALVMLEDLEFDLLIPLSPFQTKPQYIHQLSQEVEVLAPSNKSLKQATSPHTFLTNVFSNFPELIPPPTLISDISNFSATNFPMVFVSAHQMSFFSSETSISPTVSTSQSGFLLPLSRIHCAFFIGFPHCLRFIGLQTLSSPHDHAFFTDYLEKNALLPFSLPPGFTYQRILSFLSEIIIQLGFSGMITIYFGFSNDKIYPVSCNVLPDENFDLWEIKSSKTLIPLLFSSRNDQNHLLTSSNFVFKLPIYSHRSIKVPSLSKRRCIQKNLAGAISHPDYPLCALLGTSSSSSGANFLLQQEKKEILRIFPSST
ncbi:MAG: hypothetical protein ACXADY_25745 [Candidatus Hodarchaeales archaeon]|jgi:hypothetical protein